MKGAKARIGRFFFGRRKEGGGGATGVTQSASAESKATASKSAFSRDARAHTEFPAKYNSSRKHVHGISVNRNHARFEVFSRCCETLVFTSREDLGNFLARQTSAYLKMLGTRVRKGTRSPSGALSKGLQSLFGRESRNDKVIIGLKDVLFLLPHSSTVEILRLASKSTSRPISLHLAPLTPEVRQILQAEKLAPHLDNNDLNDEILYEAASFLHAAAIHSISTGLICAENFSSVAANIEDCSFGPHILKYFAAHSHSMRPGAHRLGAIMSVYDIESLSTALSLLRWTLGRRLLPIITAPVVNMVHRETGPIDTGKCKAILEMVPSRDQNIFLVTLSALSCLVHALGRIGETNFIVPLAGLFYEVLLNPREEHATPMVIARLVESYNNFAFTSLEKQPSGAPNFVDVVVEKLSGFVDKDHVVQTHFKTRVLDLLDPRRVSDTETPNERRLSISLSFAEMHRKLQEETSKN